MMNIVIIICGTFLLLWMLCACHSTKQMRDSITLLIKEVDALKADNKDLRNSINILELELRGKKIIENHKKNVKNHQ